MEGNERNVLPPRRGAPAKASALKLAIFTKRKLNQLCSTAPYKKAELFRKQEFQSKPPIALCIAKEYSIAQHSRFDFNYKPPLLEGLTPSTIGIEYFKGRPQSGIFATGAFSSPLSCKGDDICLPSER